MTTYSGAHPMSGGHFPVSKGDATIESLIPIFGPPEKTYTYNPEDQLRHEQRSLQSIYEGKTRYLETSLSVMIKQTHNSFVTKWLLPMVEYPEMNFSWQKWHFPRTLAAQTAPQAPPEYVKHRSESFHKTMNRYELGTIMGVEEAKTEEGQFILAGNLVNVAMSISDTIEQLGLLEILAQENHWREEERRSGVQLANIEDVFAWEKKTWDILRKIERGFYVLLEAVKGIMKEIIPSDVILPEGTRSLIAWDPAEQEYWRAGPGARAKIELGGDAIGNSARYPPGSLRFHVTKEFVVDYNDGVRIAPLKRTRVIGDFFVLDDWHQDCPASRYKTCFRSTLVFDMSSGRGVWTKVKLEEAINASERFETDDEGNLSHSHYELAADVLGATRRSELTLGKNGFADMFLYRTSDGLSYDVARVFGQMEPEALSDEAVSAFAATFSERVKDALDDSDLAAIMAGLALRTNIYDKQLGPDDVDFLKLAAAGDLGDDGVVIGNSVGGPLRLPDGAFPGGLPTGYGTIAGLRSLAIAARNGEQRLAGPRFAALLPFDAALTKLYDVVSGIFRPNHPVLDPANVAPYFASSSRGSDKRRQDSITTFAQNVLTGNVVPLYVKVGDVNDRTDLLDEAAIAGKLRSETNETPTQAGLDAKAIVELLNSANSGLSPRARAVFTDAATFGDFASDFKQSEFAAATVAAQRISEPLRSVDTSFGNFVTQLAARKRVTSDASAASLFNNVVALIDSPDRRIDSRSVGREIEAWLNVSDSIGGTNVPATGQRLTRLAVAWEQLQRASIGGDDVSIASPFDLSKRIDVTNDADLDALSQDSTVNAAVLSVASARAASTEGADGFGVARVGSKRKLADVVASQQLNAPPSFSRSYFLEASSEQHSPALDGSSKREGVLSINVNLARRYSDAAQNEKNALARIGAQMLLLAPITRRQLLSFCRHDVRVPVAILAERPLRRYETASLIFGRGGRELGEIAYSQLDVSLGANALTKTFTFNVSLWVAPVVRHPEFTYIAEDVIVTGYFGGETTVPFTRNSEIDALERTEESVYYLMVPVGSLTGPGRVRETHDVRGRFDTDIIQGRLTRAAHQTLMRKPQHPSSLYYNDVFGFAGFKPDAVASGDFKAYTSNHQNTIVHRTHQWLYDDVKGDYSRIMLNTGHFGVNIYEGHGDLRTMGFADHYKQMDYQSRAVPIA